MPHPPNGQIYGEREVERICDGLAQGIPLAVMCREKGMPHITTVMVWQRNNPEIGQRIRDAREFGWDSIAHRCRSVASGDESNGSSGDVKRDRLIVDTDLKLLAKWDPKRYGDKIEHTGSIGHHATDLPTLTEQLVTQCTMNPTLKPVLDAWARELLNRLEIAT